MSTVIERDPVQPTADHAWQADATQEAQNTDQTKRLTLQENMTREELLIAAAVEAAKKEIAEFAKAPLNAEQLAYAFDGLTVDERTDDAGAVLTMDKLLADIKKLGDPDAKTDFVGPTIKVGVHGETDTVGKDEWLLPSDDVLGAFISPEESNTEGGILIISEKLLVGGAEDRLAQYAMEELGEALGVYAASEDVGVTVAEGDVGARILKVTDYSQLGNADFVEIVTDDDDEEQVENPDKVQVYHNEKWYDALAAAGDGNVVIGWKGLDPADSHEVADEGVTLLTDYLWETASEIGTGTEVWASDLHAALLTLPAPAGGTIALADVQEMARLIHPDNDQTTFSESELRSLVNFGAIRFGTDATGLVQNPSIDLTSVPATATAVGEGSATAHNYEYLAVDWGVSVERATEIMDEVDATLFGPPYMADAYPIVVGWSELVDHYGVTTPGQLTAYELGHALADGMVTTELAHSGDAVEEGDRTVNSVDMVALATDPPEQPDPEGGVETSYDHDIADLYGVTDEHYENTLASALAFLAEQPGGTIGMDTDYANLDFHALLPVYGDKTQEYDMDAYDLTRAILDGAMSLPAEAAYATSSVNTVVDNTSSLSVTLAVFDSVRASHYPESDVPPEALTAEEFDEGLDAVLLGANNYGPEHYDDMTAAFGDVVDADGTTKLSPLAVQSTMITGVLHKDGSAEGLGNIPFALDEVALRSYIETGVTFEGHIDDSNIPEVDESMPVSEVLNTILSAGSGVTVPEIEALDELASAKVADRLANLTDADDPELLHYDQLLKLKTAAEDPSFSQNMDIDAVNDDIQAMALTAPVIAMFNETHEEAIFETFGVTGAEQATTFLNFATDRATIASIMTLSEADKEYVVNHLVAIMARFDPDEAAAYSDMLYPFMVGEQVNHAMENNGRLLAAADDTVENADGETELTDDAKEERDEQVFRWLGYAISQPRNMGGASLEWVSSLKNASAADFRLFSDRVSAFTQLPSTNTTTLSTWISDFIADPNSGLEDVSTFAFTPDAIIAAEESGALAEGWGIFAAFSVALDIYSLNDKIANGETPTAADYAQAAGDVMQMVSGAYNGRKVLTTAAEPVYSYFQKSKVSPFDFALQQLASADPTNVNAEPVNTFISEFLTAKASGATAQGEFVANYPSLQTALGLTGETTEHIEQFGHAYFQRAVSGLAANGATSDVEITDYFLALYDDGIYLNGDFSIMDNEGLLTDFEILPQDATAEQLTLRTAAAAENVEGFGYNDAIIVQQRAETMAARVWEGEDVAIGGAEAVGADGVSAAAMEVVGWSSRAMGLLGSAANFVYSGIEVDKAIEEFQNDHYLLGGLHGAMAADFAMIGTASIGGTIASVMGATALAATLSATAGWGVAALLAFQLVTAIVEEEQEIEERIDLDGILAAASTGENGRAEEYYYTPGEWEDDGYLPPDNW